MDKSNAQGQSPISPEATEPSTEQGALFGEDVARGEKELGSEEPAGTSTILGGTACNFCGIPVDASDPTVYEEVVSWVAGKKKDSAVLRTRTGRCACGECINKLRRGIAPDQPSVAEALDATPGTADSEYSLPTDRSPAYLDGLADGRAGFPRRIWAPESVDESDYVSGYAEGAAERDANDFLGGASR